MPPGKKGPAETGADHVPKSMTVIYLTPLAADENPPVPAD
jgi:hypothetical protein